MVVNGRWIYVADGPGGLKVVDCASKLAPIIVKSLPSVCALRVYIRDNHLYVCDGPGGLKVFSIQDPSNPILTQTVDSKWATSIAFANGYIYLGDYLAGIYILDNEDPAHPTRIDQKQIGRTRDILVDGPSLVISDSTYGLSLFFFNTLVDPQWTYSDSSRMGNFKDVISHKGCAFIERDDDASNIDVFDISSPFYTKYVSEIRPARFISGLSGTGDVLLAACESDGVLAFDMSNPGNLTLLWSIKTKGIARKARAVGGFMCVAEMTSLSIYDIKGLGGHWE
jgi:hypothetical protein